MTARVAVLVLAGCASDPKGGDTSTADDPLAFGTYDQRTGDPDAGLHTLLYGDYVGSGIPAAVWFDIVGEVDDGIGRTGDNGKVPIAFNVFDTPNGVEVVGGVTCFGCHSGELEGERVLGLGNWQTDQTHDESGRYALLADMVADRYGADSPEVEASWRVTTGSSVAGPHQVMPFAGPNPAFALEQAVASVRDPVTLDYLDTPTFEPPPLPGADVPALWLLKRKRALYWTGLGEGDHARLLSQTAIVGIFDVDALDAVDAGFPDVLAWIYSLEAPAWPGDVDTALAADGEALFAHHCADCHGTYGPDGAWTNRVVPLDTVGTDPIYAEALQADSPLVQWLSASWWASGDTPGVFAPKPGYIAPPLDGVWATAPYFHNGSVPDLVGVLDSSERPAAWKAEDDSMVDRDRVGRRWTTAEPGGTDVFDTSVVGYGNGGHTFGDGLTASERNALLEYLKTL